MLRRGLIRKLYKGTRPCYGLPPKTTLRERPFDLPRAASGFFVGKRLEDCWHKIGEDVSGAQKQVEDVLYAEELGKQEVRKFVDVAHQVRDILSDRNYRPISLRLDQYTETHDEGDLVFNNILSLCLRNSWRAARKLSVETSRLLVTGTGKSALLRTTAVISSVLLPNYQTVFVGLPQIADRRDVLENAIRYAAYHAGCGIETDDPIDAAYGYFRKANCALGVFVDDADILVKESLESEVNLLCSVRGLSFCSMNK